MSEVGHRRFAEPTRVYNALQSLELPLLKLLTQTAKTLLAAIIVIGSVSIGVGCSGDDNAAGTNPALPASIAVSPAGGASDVPVNAALSSSFNVAMTPLTAADFTLSTGGTNVPGVVTTSVDGKSATFVPSTALAADTLHTATIATTATSLTGTPIAAARTWTFTTGSLADTTAPTVTSRSPLADAIDVPLNSKPSATFSEAMDPESITATSFTMRRGVIQETGVVTYGPGTTATFTPEVLLLPATTYTATISTTASDLQGNALSSAVEWSFTTGAAAVVTLGPAPVGLGAAGNFVILAKSGVSTVPFSNVTGDVGLSPAAASFVTGFSLTADASNIFASSTQVTGQVFASNYAVPTPNNLTVAVGNMESAYTDAANRPLPDSTELGGGNIGGLTLVPGLYKWTTTVSIPTSVTLTGGANDVWIFQTTGDLTQSSATTVNLSGGAQAKNIFWQVAGIVTIGANAHFEGIVLCQTEVTLVTGASLNGRILAQTQVALQQATVTEPTE